MCKNSIHYFNDSVKYFQPLLSIFYISAFSFLNLSSVFCSLSSILCLLSSVFCTLITCGKPYQEVLVCLQTLTSSQTQGPYAQAKHPCPGQLPRQKNLPRIIYNLLLFSRPSFMRIDYFQRERFNQYN